MSNHFTHDKPLVPADPNSDVDHQIAKMLDVLASSHAPYVEPQVREHKRTRLVATLRDCLRRKGFPVLSEQFAPSVASNRDGPVDTRKRPPSPEYVDAVAQCLALARVDYLALVRQLCYDSIKDEWGAKKGREVIQRLFHV